MTDTAEEINATINAHIARIDALLAKGEAIIRRLDELRGEG